MNNWKKITLEEFIDKYNNYPPNWWIRFVFKYFSQNSETENLKLNKWLSVLLLSLFGAGLFSKTFNLPREIVGSITITYSIIISILVIFLLIGSWMNNLRIRKIAKSLNITLEEYNMLIDKFF